MLLGVLSDTHDEQVRTRAVVKEMLTYKVSALVHCGDITGPEIIQICSCLPFYFVFGNHDADRVPELKAAAKQYGAICCGWGDEFEFNGKQIAATHGHMTMDITPLISCEPDYLLTGHSHEAMVWKQNSTTRVCPGALHRSDRYTYAIIDVRSNHLEIKELTE